MATRRIGARKQYHPGTKWATIEHLCFVFVVLEKTGVVAHVAETTTLPVLDFLYWLVTPTAQVFGVSRLPLKERAEKTLKEHSKLLASLNLAGVFVAVFSN